jgi:hypothetical protein
MIEKWETIKEYNDIYEISNKGQVRRVIPSRWAKAKILSPGISKRGVKNITLSKNAVKHKYLVHRLVALYFLGQPPKNKRQINHKNGNPSDNVANNLEWCSPKENVQHGIKTGLIKIIGADHWKSRLSEKDIKEIRKIYKTGQISQTELGRRYKVTQANIWSIVNNKRWKLIK